MQDIASGLFGEMRWGRRKWKTLAVGETEVKNTCAKWGQRLASGTLADIKTKRDASTRWEILRRTVFSFDRSGLAGFTSRNFPVAYP